MVIHQHYYQLEEKHFSEVNPAWKICHICIFAIIIVAGFVCAFSFGSLLHKFEFNCILFTDIQIKNQTINSSTTSDQINENSSISTTINDEYVNSTTDNSLNSSNVTENIIQSTTKRNITIDYEHTLWRPHTLCFFTQFSPIISMIMAIILIVFFMMAPPGGVTHPGVVSHYFIPNGWTIIFPTLVFSGFMAIASFMTTLKLNRGLDHFYVQWFTESKEFTLNFKNIEDVIPIYYHLTLVSAYIEVFGWMTQCALLLLRIFCVADFNVRIMQIQEKIQLEDDDDDLRNAHRQHQARRANNSESSESIEEITEV